jgi:hypothetical protein
LGRGSGSNVDLPANNTSGTNEKTNRKAIVYSTIENILANRERTVKGIINRGFCNMSNLEGGANQWGRWRVSWIEHFGENWSWFGVFGAITRRRPHNKASKRSEQAGNSEPGR